MKNYELIDTHCHLYLEDFKNDLPAYIERARAEGVSRIYLPSLDKNHFLSMVGLEEKFPGFCFSMAGIHPCYVKENFRDELQFLQEQLSGRRFWAVGEIGLDYYWDRTHDQEQMTCFLEQIALAKQYGLPIVIHSRSSMNETIAVLRQQKDALLRGIFHCFSGTYENAMDVINCGLMLGIGGVVTYKNAGLAEVVARLPLESIVLETDAPYLTPVPFRGKRNESSYLKYVVEKIAEVKGVSVEEVATITSANAKKVFAD
jgi:TatD DNase family protein